MNQPPPNQSVSASAALPPKKPSHRKLIKWLLLAAPTLGGCLLLVLIIAANALELNRAALVAGMILAALPVPLYAALILWFDRFEHEPRYLLFTSFLWGATASIFAALIVNTFVLLSLGKFAATVISAPIIEEIAKAAILLAIFLVKSDELNDVADGVIYAAITALGFATIENFAYYGRAFAEVYPVGTLGVFIARGIENPFLHPFLTSMTGIGFGLAAQTRNKIVRVAAPLGGLMLAILLHAAWNYSSVAGIFRFVYYILMVPAFFAVIAILAFAVRREKKIICRYLLDEIAAGRLNESEYRQLTSLRGRCSAPVRALFSKGFRGWRAQRECSQAAGELAFVRQRAAQGFPVDPARLNDCETAFLNFLRQTRGT